MGETSSDIKMQVLLQSSTLAPFPNFYFCYLSKVLFILELIKIVHKSICIVSDVNTEYFAKFHKNQRKNTSPSKLTE